MVKSKRQKDKQCCLFVFFFWSLHCLSLCLFLLTIALFVFLSFTFDHCIVCLYVFFFWQLHCGQKKKT
jgi:hypothetical protein